MKLTELYRNDYAIIEVNLQNKYIQVTWFQHTSLATLRDILGKALKFANTKDISLWLHDCRKLCYVTIADQNWIAQKFYAAFNPRQQHRSACVVSAHNVDLIPEGLISEHIRNDRLLAENLELKYFLDKDLAEFWLSERFQFAL